VPGAGFQLLRRGPAVEPEPQVVNRWVTSLPKPRPTRMQLSGLAKRNAFALRDIKSPYVLVEQFKTSVPLHGQAPSKQTVYHGAAGRRAEKQAEIPAMARITTKRVKGEGSP